MVCEHEYINIAPPPLPLINDAHGYAIGTSFLAVKDKLSIFAAHTEK